MLNNATSEDIDTIRAAYAAQSGQLDKAIIEIDRLREESGKFKNDLDIMIQKTIHAETNENKYKQIMTQNLTESNAQMQSYIGEIQELKGVIQQLKAQLDSQ